MSSDSNTDINNNEFYYKVSEITPLPIIYFAAISFGKSSIYLLNAFLNLVKYFLVVNLFLVTYLEENINLVNSIILEKEKNNEILIKMNNTIELHKIQIILYCDTNIDKTKNFLKNSYLTISDSFVNTYLLIDSNITTTKDNFKKLYMEKYQDFFTYTNLNQEQEESTDETSSEEKKETQKKQEEKQDEDHEEKQDQDHEENIKKNKKESDQLINEFKKWERVIKKQNDKHDNDDNDDNK